MWRRRRDWGDLVARAGIVVALLLAPLPARADGPSAGASFDYGLSEMLAGRYATACPALEESLRLDPRPGTLFTLADCNRKAGKTASALARFDEYLALYERMPADQQAKQRERAAVATSERARLEKTVPLLAVRLPEGAPPGTRVWRDDVELTGAALVAAIPVDPGEHRVRAQLPDGSVEEDRVMLEAGEQRTLVVGIRALPAIHPPEPAVQRPPPPPPPAPAPVQPSVPPPPVRASHAGWTYVTAGVGVASLVVAGITGGVALGQRSVASPVCDPQGAQEVCTTEAGVNAGNEAHTMANVETGALVVGGVALVVAIVLWATEPRARRSANAPTPAGVVAVW